MSKITHVLYVTGHDTEGAMFFDPAVIGGINARLPLTLVGNPQSGCSLAGIEQAVGALPENSRPLIIMRAHGSTHLHRHRVTLSKEVLQNTDELFKAIAKANKQKPIDTLLGSCGGNIAQNYVDCLPTGSTVISKGNGIIYANLQEGAISRIPEGMEITATTIMDAYLTTKGEQYWDDDRHNCPLFCVSGGSKSDLAANLRERKGTSFSPDEKERIYSRLAPFLDDGQRTADRIIRLIERAIHPSSEYLSRLCMATAFAASPETTYPSLALPAFAPARPQGIDMLMQLQSGARPDFMNRHP